MEFNTIQGLRFSKKPEYSGKMFLTDFEDETAKQVIEEMEAALHKLSLYNIMSGAYASTAQEGEMRLQAIADDNIELYLYGMKAVMTNARYFVPENDTGHIYKECLSVYLANAINGNPEKWMPIFKHILQVWPHSKYWKVVNDILCGAYAMIQVSDAECIRIIASGLLRDPSSWRASFDAMMIRAKSYANETITQFSEVFNFLDIYGQSATGKDGIAIPQDIYSWQQSKMQQAFREQSEEMQQELREIGLITIGSNQLIKSYLSRMFGTSGSGEDLGELEELLRSDPVAARNKVRDSFNVRAAVGWERLQSPELVELIGEKMTDQRFSISEKQILGYRLSVFRSKAQNNWAMSEASQTARRILLDYHPIDDSDQEYVLAGCLKMLAVASDSRYNVNPNAVQNDMTELLIRHADMEVNQRRLLDGKQTGGIWRNMTSKYSLNPAIKMSLASMIHNTELSSAEAVRRIFKIIADTFAPLELNNPRVLRDAVPHEEVKIALHRILALDATTRRFKVDHDFMRTALPKILDALEAIMNHEIFNMHYRDIVSHLHIYCSSLDDSNLRRIRDSHARILSMVNTFHQE